MRLDKYLKLARLVKRRSAAQEMIELGAVRVAGRPVKPAADIKQNDIIEIAYMSRVLKVKVLCADEAILKRPRAESPSWEQISERPVKPDENPWQD
ncbi:MAG: RNA-binding S4 domain-containing protein [Synergistaceae bacterium]|nr:RNA-binding S4 domain-containing protein [Synergistaceae bacterium]